MVETQTKVIDGMTFKVTQLPAMRSLKTLTRIGKAVGPALAQAANALGQGAQVDLSAAGEALATLFENLTGDELEAITRVLLDKSYAIDPDGKAIELLPVFDYYMAGKIPTVLKLLKFAFEVNYGNFFDGLRALAAQQGAVKVSASQESTI